jgi:hypothetical protein
MLQCENLVLLAYRKDPLHALLSQTLPRLLRLSLQTFHVDDAILAEALRNVSGTHQFPEIVGWLHSEKVRVSETMWTMGTMKALQRLDLQNCPGVTHSMLEPLLIGSPRQLPLCPNLRAAHICLEQRSPQFILRLRQSILERFPDTSERDIGGW